MSGAKTAVASNTNGISANPFEDRIELNFQDSRDRSIESSQLGYSSNDSHEFIKPNNNSIDSGFTTGGDGEFRFFKTRKSLMKERID